MPKHIWFKPVIIGLGLMVTATVPLHAWVAPVPSKPLTTKYPEAYLSRINDVAICLAEAEAELYDDKTLASLPALPILDKTSDCQTVLAQTDYQYDIRYRVDFNKAPREAVIAPLKTPHQNPLTILDEPLTVDPTSPYYQNTEALEIAMRLFIDLNIDFHHEVSMAYQDYDQLDHLFIRLMNAAYTLPKNQGVPLFKAFMIDIRDSYFRECGTSFFQNLIFYADNQNTYSELTVFLDHMASSVYYAGTEWSTFVPTDMPENPGTPEDDDYGDLPSGDDLDDMIWDDLKDQFDSSDSDSSGDQPFDNIKPGTTVTYEPILKDPESSQVTQTTTHTYQLVDGVCHDTLVVMEGDKLITEETFSLSEAEQHKCDADYDPLAEDDLEVAVFQLHYQFLSDKDTIHPTTFDVSETHDMSYRETVKVLKQIMTKHGVGYLETASRFLFVYNGRAFVLPTFDETQTIQALNDWFASQDLDLVFHVGDPTALPETDETQDEATPRADLD